jgi:hypothetical protein
MQTDGNLVIYTAGGTWVWQSGTGGDGASHAILQDDGNFVVYTDSGNTATYNTGTGGHTTYTYFGSNQLTSGQTLWQNEFLRSSDNRYALLLQGDNNIVLYGPGYHVLWSSATTGDGGTGLIMHSDGNLVLKNSLGTPEWDINTGGQGSSYAVMQTDGNFVVYRSSDNTSIYNTNTHGLI